MKKRSLFLLFVLTFLLVSIASLTLIVKKNIFSVKDQIYKKYPNLKKEFRKNLFNSKSVINNLKNDYNVKFLPETQFINLNLEKKKNYF